MLHEARVDPVLKARLETVLELSSRPVSMESLQILMERPAADLGRALVALQEEGRVFVLNGGWRHVKTRRPIRDAAIRGALLRDLLDLLMSRGMVQKDYVVIGELTTLADDLEAQG